VALDEELLSALTAVVLERLDDSAVPVRAAAVALLPRLVVVDDQVRRLSTGCA
jgi:hypothetical protein